MFDFEQSFIQKVVQKDSQSFNKLYLQTVDQFFRYIKSRYYVEDADCHDLLADFYCKLRKGLDKYNDMYPFEAYMWTILKNTLKDFFKKQSESYFSQLDSEEVRFEENLENDDGSLLEQLSVAYANEHIQEAMNQLDGQSKDILYRRYVEDKPHEYIATIIWLSSDNVRKKLSRALKKLQKILSHL